jgi:hypothetical protein
MLNVPMDVNTIFNVYKLTYVCTYAYSDHDKALEGVYADTYLITDTQEAVEHWFREAFNCHGDIHDLLHIEEVACDVQFDMMHYYCMGEERNDET